VFQVQKCFRPQRGRNPPNDRNDDNERGFYAEEPAAQLFTGRNIVRSFLRTLTRPKNNDNIGGIVIDERKRSARFSTPPLDQIRAVPSSSRIFQKITLPMPQAGVPTRPSQAPKVPTRPSQAPKVPTRPLQALKVPTRPAQVPQAPTQPAEAPQASTRPAQAPNPVVLAPINLWPNEVQRVPPNPTVTVGNVAFPVFVPANQINVPLPQPANDEGEGLERSFDESGDSDLNDEVLFYSPRPSPTPSPILMRRSPRKNKGIGPSRYGSPISFY
jgi:hypothetical protein